MGDEETGARGDSDNTSREEKHGTEPARVEARGVDKSDRDNERKRRKRTTKGRNTEKGSKRSARAKRRCTPKTTKVGERRHRGKRPGVYSDQRGQIFGRQRKRAKGQEATKFALTVGIKRTWAEGRTHETQAANRQRWEEGEYEMGGHEGG